jgi:hypothetical protein
MSHVLSVTMAMRWVCSLMGSTLAVSPVVD